MRRALMCHPENEEILKYADGEFFRATVTSAEFR